MSENFELHYNTEQSYWVGKFKAMAGPCELIIDSKDENLANHITSIAQIEAKRIEQKFSRYRNDNIVFKINQSNGETISVDSETEQLLDYANECYLLSDGLFDITSGVLREIWTFDTSSNLPSQQRVDAILHRVGWRKVNWDNSRLTLQKNMEIDFGGIGKEYAVDRSAMLIVANTGFKHVLLNFGGDIHAPGPRTNDDAWEIGLQDPNGEPNKTQAKIELYHGAVTTSGDLHKYLKKDGIRYGHILNPKTGWPSMHSPRQVTVLGSTCLEAGILSTLAILYGEKAEEFLTAQEIEHKIIR